MKGRIVAASVVSAALALALAGCGSQQDASRTMTDEEIMAAIERGDDETLSKAREEAQAAIEDALVEFEALTDEEREALRESILSEVEARLANVGTTTVNRYVTEKAGDTYVTETHPTYVTEENTYVTQGEEVPPRIEDGMAIPVAWDVQREFVYVQNEYVFETYTVNEIEARAYNFASDTPYAGGGYAYRIEVTVSGTLDRVVDAPPDVAFPMISGYCLPVDLLMDPYDEPIDGLIAPHNDYDAGTFTITYSINTNALPDQIYAVMK